MAKPKTRYICQACGSEQSRWQGQCADCAEWNTLVQEAAVVERLFGAPRSVERRARVELVGLDSEVALPERLATGIAEFDRAIGGGIVAGSAMLVGGDPGIGKSTLLLQVAAKLALDGHARRLCLGRGSGRPGAAARGAAGARRFAGPARRGDLGARHPDDGRRRASRRRCW